MAYQLSSDINREKTFIVNKSEIEGRLDSEFYKPSIALLENKIRSLSTKKLRAYVLAFAGGATPSKKESGKYYSDSPNGIPFLRVQNLQTTGELLLDGCLYINDETHNGLLKRSQVSEGDLLIKITGVGRMAIASVAPKGFVGNTNQHMVVVKTGNIEISKYLAHYFNLDIVEKIASRHSTGGTRPALDYPSLKNIPIIEGLDFSFIDDAIKTKKEKETEAQQLLESIDNYLLNELGIILPESKKSLSHRIFLLSYRQVIGKRIDPKKYSISVRELYDSILNSPYEKTSLKNLITNVSSGDWGDECENTEIPKGFVKCLVLRATEFDNQYNLNIDSRKVKYRLLKQASYDKIKISENDIIIEKSGGSEDLPVGRVAILDKHVMALDTNIAFSNFLAKITVRNVNPIYLYYFLKMVYHIGITEVMQSQTNGIRNLIMAEFLSQQIVLPSSVKQQEIVEHITAIQQKAKALQEEGKRILENAKHEVERMIMTKE